MYYLLEQGKEENHKQLEVERNSVIVLISRFFILNQIMRYLFIRRLRLKDQKKR